MKKEDIKSYLKIFAVLMMISPLCVAYFRSSNCSVNESFAYTGFMYFVLMILAILMYNYLEYGKFRLWINHHEKIKNFNEWFYEFELKLLYNCACNKLDINPNNYKFLYYEGFSVNNAVKYCIKNKL